MNIDFKIKIKNIDNNYLFDIKKIATDEKIFSLENKHHIIPFLKSSYKYAWQALRDANCLITKYSYHLNFFNKESRYDLEKPIIAEVSAEEMLLDHYSSLYASLEKRIKFDKDEDDKKILEMTIQEITQIESQITDKKDKKKITKLLNSFKNLCRKNFKSNKK